jgi:CBS domain-containing protein
LPLGHGFCDRRHIAVDLQAPATATGSPRETVDQVALAAITYMTRGSVAGSSTWRALLENSAEEVTMRPSDPVSDLMTEAVLSIEMDAPAGEILRLFNEYPVHHLPVVDEGKVVGMLSSADVRKLESLLPKGRDPMDYLSWRFRIDQLMRQPAITIGPHEPIETAASLMVKRGIHALPVINSRQKLIGIVTTTDIMNAALQPEQRRCAQATTQSQTSARETDADRGEMDLGAGPADMQRALSLARAAGNGRDEKAQIARALLQACSRLKQLEALRSWAERYVHLRQDEYLHGALLEAMEQTRNESPPQPNPLPI